MLKLLLAVMFFIPAAMPASAGDVQPCYGKKEQQLARKLLDLPALMVKIEREREKVQLLRDETCGRVELIDITIDPPYASFFRDTGWRPVWEAAWARSLNPSQVMSAMVDFHFGPPVKKKKTT